MDVKSKISQDVNNLTSAASKLGTQQKPMRDKAKNEEEAKSQQAPEARRAVLERCFAEESAKEELSHRPSIQGAKVQEVFSIQKIVPASTETRWAAQKQFTLSDLLQCLGAYVHLQCRNLVSSPAAAELVSTWVRGVDADLLYRWTMHSFLLESHIVFTYMLLQKAFERFHIKTLLDAKELVLMCLYISYAYNGNEISYPLRPFLVKQNRVAFWSKCTELSVSRSGHMLKLNRSRRYYLKKLSSLKSVIA